MGIRIFTVVLVAILLGTLFGIELAKSRAKKEASLNYESDISWIKSSWPEGKYLFCKYAKKNTKCIQCMLGGEDPVTDFELCSEAMKNDIK